QPDPRLVVRGGGAVPPRLRGPCRHRAPRTRRPRRGCRAVGVTGDGRDPCGRSTTGGPPRHRSVAGRREPPQPRPGSEAVDAGSGMSTLGLDGFRVLFAQEAEGRLATLSQLALALEGAGNDDTIIAAIFREVHTLKGSAAVVGFDAVSDCAHRLEERLVAQRLGASPGSTELVDAILQAVDELTSLTTGSTATEGRQVAAPDPVSKPPATGSEVELRPLAIPPGPLPSPAARAPAPAHDTSVVMVPL